MILGNYIMLGYLDPKVEVLMKVGSLRFASYGVHMNVDMVAAHT